MASTTPAPTSKHVPKRGLGDGALFFLKDFESGVQVFLEDEGRLSATTSLARGAQGAGRGLEPRLTPRGRPKVAGI